MLNEYRLLAQPASSPCHRVIASRPDEGVCKDQREEKNADTDR